MSRNVSDEPIGPNVYRKDTGDDLCWWHSLKEECPITLELLSDLPYPPFSLTSGKTSSFFDGLALGSYIVSRGIFQNPLTREDLTMEDCRQLDDYLETYCYSQQRKPSPSNNYCHLPPRKICVADAFALRSSVQVARSGGDDRSSARAQRLQNTAAAALAGLFVYRSHRTHTQGQPTANTRRTQQEALDSNDGLLAHFSNPSLPPEDQLMLDWGFDLRRPLNNFSQIGDEGWMVIDDDEALVVASQKQAYEASQNAFPPLSEETNASADAPPQVDDQFMKRVRELSLKEKQEIELRERKLALVRQRLIEEALDRRDKRKRQLEIERKERAEQWENMRRDKAELELAKAEIEAWREEHWDMLRSMSESQKKQSTQEIIQRKEATAPSIVEAVVESSKAADSEGLNQETADEIALKKKAKAVAKRKRAKERKKIQKAEERVARAKKEQKKALEAKKAASTLVCNACQQGIIDCGFEKFNKKFCSPKCARTAKP